MTDLDVALGNEDPPVPDEIHNMLESVGWQDDEVVARPATLSIHVFMLQRIAARVIQSVFWSYTY